MLIVLPLLGLCISSTSIFPAALPFPAARTTTTAPNGAYSNSIPTSTVYANSPPSSITDYGNDGNNNNATYSRSSSSGGIVTAGKPLFQEHIVIVGAIPVNQTFKRVSLVGNGTLNLENSMSILKTNSTRLGRC